MITPDNLIRGNLIMQLTYLLALTCSLGGHGQTSTASPDAIFKNLIQGNERFASFKSKHPGLNKARRDQLAKGQNPPAIILTCADSRLSPEFIFDQGPGDLFVVRVAGNIVDVNELASMEYAASHLGSKLIFVLGHERCGAVKAAVDAFGTAISGPAEADHEDHGNVPELIARILPAVEDASECKPANLLDAAIACNVKRTISKISQRSSILRNLFITNKVAIKGGVFDLDSGKVNVLAETSTNFVKACD